jgi:hypothetical protein
MLLLLGRQVPHTQVIELELLLLEHGLGIRLLFLLDCGDLLQRSRPLVLVVVLGLGHLDQLPLRLDLLQVEQVELGLEANLGPGAFAFFVARKLDLLVGILFLPVMNLFKKKSKNFELF